MKKKFQVLYEDNHLIIVNKKAGLLVHGDSTGDETLEELVKKYLKKKYNKPGNVFLGVVHRIDRPVSGVVVLARTSKSLSRLNKMLQERKITKEYRAIVWDRPPEFQDRLTHYLEKDSAKNITKVFNRPKGRAKQAILSYEYLSEISHYILLKVDLETGRPHQIRAQLKQIGSPIVGDRKYGFHKFNQDRSICLHCFKMSFQHPVTKENLSFSAPFPKQDIWNLFDQQ